MDALVATVVGIALGVLGVAGAHEAGSGKIGGTLVTLVIMFNLLKPREVKVEAES